MCSDKGSCGLSMWNYGRVELMMKNIKEHRTVYVYMQNNSTETDRKEMSETEEVKESERRNILSPHRHYVFPIPRFQLISNYK